MPKIKIEWLTLIIFILGLSGAQSQDFYLKNLVVNYSDFSMINDIAVGYNYVYFGTTNGVIRYNFTTDSWGEPLTGKEGFADRIVYRVAVFFDDSKVWIKTDEGIYNYIDVFNSWIPDAAMPVENLRGRHILADNNYFAPVGYAYIPGGALSDSRQRIFQIVDIFEDEYYHHWLSIWGLGAAVADATDRKINLLDYGLLQEKVTVLYDYNEEIWISGPASASARSGFTIFHPGTNEFDYLEEYENLFGEAVFINDICGGKKKLYAATDYGVLVIDPEERKIIDRINKNAGLPDDQALCVELNGDTLFTGTNYGLGLLSLNADTAVPLYTNLFPQKIITCLEMTDNALWIGTNDGLYRYLLKTGKVEKLESVDFPGNSSIDDIKFGLSKIWIVADGRLFSLNKQTARFENYPELEKYGSITKIAVVDSLVAAAGDAGLILFSDGKPKQQAVFNTQDGLLSNNILSIRFKNDYLWLGTERGLTRFWYKHPQLF